MKRPGCSTSSTHRSLSELKELGELKRFKFDIDFYCNALERENSSEERKDSLDQFWSKFTTDFPFEMRCKSQSVLGKIFSLGYDISSSKPILLEMIDRMTLEEIIQQQESFVSFIKQNLTSGVEIIVEHLILPHQDKSSLSELRAFLTPWFSTPSTQSFLKKFSSDWNFAKFLHFFSTDLSNRSFAVELFFFDPSLLTEEFYLQLLLNLTGESVGCNRLFEKFPLSFEIIFKSVFELKSFVGFAVLINLVEYCAQFRSSLLTDHLADLRVLSCQLGELIETPDQIHSIIALFLGSFCLLDGEFAVESEFLISKELLIDLIAVFFTLNLASGNNKLLWNDSFKQVITVLKRN